MNINANSAADAYIAKKTTAVAGCRKIDEFRSGDLICVHTVIVTSVIGTDKKKKELRRIQKFEGRCIGRHGAGFNATYTVWNGTGEIGIRRVFPLYAYDVELIRRGKVRREKLNYLTQLRGKDARIKDRRVVHA